MHGINEYHMAPVIMATYPPLPPLTPPMVERCTRRGVSRKAAAERPVSTLPPPSGELETCVAGRRRGPDRADVLRVPHLVQRGPSQQLV